MISATLLTSSCNGQGKPESDRPELQKIQKNTPIPFMGSHPFQEPISGVVRMMFQDSKGHIWFGSEGGAFRLVNNTLIHIDDIKSETGKGVTIKDITEDTYGTIWLGHSDGISRVDGEKVTNYYTSDGLMSDDVWCIETDRSGHLWIGTIDGICIFDGKKFTPFGLPEGMKDTTMGVSSAKMIHCIMKDRNGAMWLSTNAGLFLYANNTVINVSEKVGIETPFVNETLEDKNGHIWVATKKGLYKIEDNKAIQITQGKIDPGKGIGCIGEDKNGKIWFVSNQHHLYTCDGNDIAEVPKSDDNKGPVVFQIYEDQSDRLWFVGFGGAYRWENGKFIHVTRQGPW